MSKDKYKETVNLFDTGECYRDLSDKIIHTAINKGGGRVIVGFSDIEANANTKENE